MQQDNLKKEASALGWLFFIAMAVHVICSVAVNILEQKGITLPVEFSLIISELMIFIPALIYVINSRLSFSEDLGFRGVKLGTALISVFMSFLVWGVGSFFNVLSQIFVSNTMVQMSDTLLGGSNVAVWFLASIYGPFCEEFVFRSVFNRRYEFIIGPMRAGLISALYFALAHLTFNQAAYAFVLGLMFSIINKAAGSVYPSMIIHMCINGCNMLMIMVMTGITEEIGSAEDLAAAAEAARGSDMIYILIAVTLVGAIISLLILIPCVVFVSKHENRFEELVSMFKTGQSKGRWFTFSSALAICFTLFIMFGLRPLLSALGM